MTTYTGPLAISGRLSDNRGDFIDLSGTMLVTSRMTLLAGGQIYLNTDYGGTLTLTTHLNNGSVSTTTQSLSQYGSFYTTSLSNFNVPLGPLDDGLGGTLTETYSFSGDRATLGIAASLSVNDTISLVPYGGSGSITVTGAAAVSGTLTAGAEGYSVTLAQPTHSEGNGGSTAFVFTIHRSGDTVQPASIAWSVAGSGGASANGADFTGGVLPSGTVNFAVFQSQASVTVLVAGDTLAEPDEQFTLSLAPPAGALYLRAPQIGAGATATILTDDSVFDLTAQQMVLYEGNGAGAQFSFTITRSGTLGAAASVGWSAAGFSTYPADAADFAGGILPSGTAQFAAGQTSATVTIAAQPDLTVEPDETFLIQLSAPSAGASLGTAVIAGIIANDDASLSVAIPYPGQIEDVGANQFVITRTGQLATAATVAWQVTGSGATPADAADFTGNQLPSGIASFTAGQAGLTLDIPIAADTLYEPDEGYTVSLHDPVSANPNFSLALATASADGFIVNDDPALASLSLSATDAAKREGNTGATPFVFTLTRTGNMALALNVGWYATLSGEANSADAADFAGGILPSGTLSLAAGQASATLTVDIAGDTQAEFDEGFRVVLLSPLTGATVTNATAAGTIINDDINFSIAAATASQREGTGAATPFLFTVTRTGDLVFANSVAWSTIGAAAGASANPADFAGGVAPSGTLSFAPGQASQTITVNVAGDSLAEADESFRVVLGAATAGAVVTTASASATIRNDDTSFAIASTTGSRPEGDSGATPFLFTVTRSGDLSGSNAVAWTTAGMAPNSVGPGDFLGGVIPSGTLSFAPGQTSQTLTVNVAGDTQMEPDEFFRVALGGATGGAGITVASAAAKIVNDDTSFSIAATDAAKPEGTTGTTPFIFTVTRSGNVAGTHSIAWMAVGQSPDSVGPADFAAGSALSGGLLFLPGETTHTITLNVQGDTLIEPDEHFQVLLRNASAGAAITTNHAAATILNDDGLAGGNSAGGSAFETTFTWFPAYDIHS